MFQIVKEQMCVGVKGIQEPPQNILSRVASQESELSSISMDNGRYSSVP